MIFASNPAAERAFAVSYSQLVPGNAGISTLGLAYRSGEWIRGEGFAVTVSTVSPVSDCGWTG